VFPRYKLALFIDGDFWHGNQWRLRGLSSLEDQFTDCANKDYWIRKITRNMERDSENDRKLTSMGWRVLRVWESEARQDFDGCVQRLRENVRLPDAKDVR
jgi:DNA mismatch endonuclease (patch repair protein)